jgi:hypothetical protein
MIPKGILAIGNGESSLMGIECGTKALIVVYESMYLEYVKKHNLPVPNNPYCNSSRLYLSKSGIASREVRSELEAGKTEYFGLRTTH